MQCQSMFEYGHNGVFSMDATLFTLIGFGAHHTKMPLTLAY